VPALSFKGGTISFESTGQGSALVLLHGFLESKDIWKDFSNQLSPRYKVVCIDLPGHGLSSNFGYHHSMELMAEAVMAVLKHLKIRRFFLLGHSMGGYVSMALAEKYPDQIKGLCLFHSTADNDSEQKKKERLKVIKVVQRDKAIFIREAVPNLFNRELKPYRQGIAKISSIASKMSVQGIIASLEGMRQRANREIVLKFAPYPVLYLIGKSDKLLSWEKLVEECALCENAEYILLENSAHMGFIEEKEKSLDAILNFLRRKI
jgi:pimeloyl-ACP methyl ester carboxylesterase